MVGGCLMGVCLTGVYLMSMHLISAYLIGMHLTGVCLMGIYLIGVHLTCVHLIGMHLMGVYLMSVDFRRGNPSWIPGFPFGRLPSDRANPNCALRDALAGNYAPPSLPSLRLEAVVECSCSVVFSALLWSFSVRLDSALLLCSLPTPQTLPVQCNPLTYCGTLAAAGYCPKYLGNLALLASERTNQTFDFEAWKARMTTSRIELAQSYTQGHPRPN
jgi:hypothetical protein